MKRRDFLKGCCFAAGAGAVPATFFVNPLAHGQVPSHDILVYLFLRGGIDGLHLVVPYSGPERVAYDNARGNMRIPVEHLRPIGDHWSLHPRAGGGPGDAVDSDPKWLQRLWLQDKLAIIHGAGMPTALSRSHFDAQAWMDLGTPGTRATSDGWLKRYLEQATGLPPALLSHVMGFSSTQPLSLMGSNDAFTVARAEDFLVDGFHWSWNQSDANISGHQGARHRIQPLWQSGTTGVDEAGQLAAEALELMRQLDFAGYQPEGGAQYPNNMLGQQMRNLAQLIKSDTGIVAATLDYGGWDTHQGQGLPNPGNAGHYDFYGNLLQGLSEAIDAFYTDLAESADGNFMNRVNIVVLSEFGRNVQGNQSHGTDHGYGNVMLAIGDQVRGGQFHGQFPGLDSGSLFEGQDLDTSTDFRQVLAEALVRRMGYSTGQLESVFPGLGSYQPLGVFEP
jgi:uncharacterized protein (DUF1501 family)